MNDWDPVLYQQFEAERTRPAQELLNRILILSQGVERATDLGCGPGNSTELLYNAWPEAAITGLDMSPAMLEKAQQRLPSCTFVQEDIRYWQPALPQNVIYANASLQWLDNHHTLFPHLIEQLAPAGVLAVQMPDNLTEPSHRLMNEVAKQTRWVDWINTDNNRQPLLSTEQYYDLLCSSGCRVDIWRTTYYHVMPSAQAIVDWLRSTGLRPYLAGLDEQQQNAYLADYLVELTRAYPPRADGSVSLAFPRLFIVAQKR